MHPRESVSEVKGLHFINALFKVPFLRASTLVRMFVPHRLPHRSLSFILSSSTFVKREDTGVEAA